ncbi:MAG: GNAT family N-acetyltransferase [Candidatus Margulisiibacteriota bacterium]
MTHAFFPLQNDEAALAFLLDDLVARCEARGVPNMKPIFDEKKQAILAGLLPGLLLKKNDEPAGFVWADMVTENYGNMVFHSLDLNDQPVLVQGLLDSGLIHQKLMELITYELHPDTRATIRAGGFLENPRKRMFLELNQAPKLPEIPPPYVLRPVTDADVLPSSALSLAAHLISQDQPSYPDLKNLATREALERKIYGGVFGPMSPTASFVLEREGRMVGACLVVDIVCWGFDRVPWIFDLSIHPDFQGQKLGRALFEAVIYQLYQERYEIVGLAVTLTNSGAIRLYDSLGFQSMEPFYEYVQPT